MDPRQSGYVCSCISPDESGAADIVVRGAASSGPSPFLGTHQEPIAVGVFVGWVKPTEPFRDGGFGGFHPPYRDRL